MHNLGSYLGLSFVFRLGSGAGVLPGQPFLVRIQTPYQEPNTTTAFEPRSAMTGSSQSANIPIPAPEPNLTGALRGTRNNHSLFQYSSDLHAGTKELDIVTEDNITVTADYQRAQCKCHYSELCNQYQDLFLSYQELYFRHQESFYHLNYYSEASDQKYQECRERYSEITNQPKAERLN